VAKPLQMETWLLLTAYKKSLLRSTLPNGMITDPYDLLLSHNSPQLDTIVPYDPSKSSKINDSHVIQKGV